jgi:tetratricopeptide (TPR) repeat protein
MIESGDYGAVRRELPKAYLTLKNPQGLALWARLEEIQGSPEHALGLLSQASAMVDHDVDALPQTVAWFHMRRGNLLAMMGRADEAMAQYGEAVALYPTDYRTMTSMARLCAGRGQWTETLAWAKRSAGIVPTPEILGLERDALHALGREVDAKNVDATIAAVGQIESSQGTAYDRMRALYNAEHGIDTAGAVSLAGGELRERHDVYAYDTLAWCLYRNGQAAEARRTMAKALAIGTKDAVIYYHAGMIALSNGDRSGAKSYLGLALRVNPYFLPFAPDSARKVLGTLV